MSKLHRVLNNSLSKQANNLAADIKHSANKQFDGTGNYAKGWTVKKNSDLSYTVYNRTQPTLTHLLENGHLLVKSDKVVGYVKGKKHIAPSVVKLSKSIDKPIVNEINKYINGLKSIDDM